MRSRYTTTMILSGAVIASFALTACGVERNDDCRSGVTILMFFDAKTGHYRYNSPTGPIVLGADVPSSARKVPGYKSPAAPKAPTGSKPRTGTAPKAPAPKPPAAPARRK